MSAPVSSLFGTSGASPQTSLSGSLSSSTPAFRTPFFGSTPASGVPTFSTPFASGVALASGASFGTVSVSIHVLLYWALSCLCLCPSAHTTPPPKRRMLSLFITSFVQSNTEVLLC
ncbi:hypothetical protein RND71_032868 [Anisodus tanguticus]|uniref:Uncharacterized protein n=1 Tax=Anisodus tanguticus TaxID=243964 RepID=A0AAE1R6S0_9SOLA|nr:hypothetical protein RND71_032868 [Anisodus tanguticus]